MEEEQQSLFLPITDILKKPRKAYESRQKLNKRFVDRLNGDRIKAGYEPLTARYIAVKMAHLNVFDLEKFYDDCANAKNFSAYWWWALDIKKHDKKTS